MKFSSISFFVCAAMFGLFVSGCAQQKPEGPAERIGKGIDEIAGAVKDYDHDHGQNQDQDSYSYRRERARAQECMGSDYYRNPRCRSDGSYGNEDYSYDSDDGSSDRGTDDSRRY